MRERAPAQPPDSVDLSATLELLASLTQYAEAGAIQPNTIAQAAQHALDEHGARVEVIVAVAKLYLAVGDRTSAAVVLGRAGGSASQDPRVTQLLAETGIEITRPGPLSEAKPRDPRAEPDDGPRRELASDFRETMPRDGPLTPPPSTAANRPPATAGSRSPATPPSRAVPAACALARPGLEEPASSRTPVSIRAPQLARPVRGSVTVQEPRPKLDTAPPSTPRSAGAEGPLLRPTVRMARVAGAPDRRWGKSEGREPFDSRPEREAAADGPRSARARPDASSSNPYLAKQAREAFGSARGARAATGNLKLLDPADERHHLDRYELIGEIASGGMATVYLARLAGVAGFQRFFAIKRLHPHLADEQEFIDMFLDEARLAAGIHHPNVVPILEVGTSEAGYYLVMDYIEGDTLSGVTNRASTAGGMPRPIALRILLDSLHGLNAAHDLADADGHPVDLVHRDCSPQNILVGIDGSSRITDFGVARASSRLSTTRSATVKGKLAYLSPEQATGRGLDRRSDLFGMGVILWEALAGRRLFRGDTDGATLSRILVEPIPALDEFAPDLPEGVCAVVTKSLARDPDDRFPTAGEMADALEQAVRWANDPALFVASPRDVAAYMRELFGADVTARRDAIRAWSQQGAESAVASGPRSAGARRYDASPPPSSARPSEMERSGKLPARKAAPALDVRQPPPADDPGDDDLPESDRDPISSGEEPPSSKTEPSVVHPDEVPAARPLPIQTLEVRSAPRDDGDPPLPSAEALTSPTPVDAAVSADPTPPAEWSPVRELVPARKLVQHQKCPPIIIIIIALALIAAAVTAFLLKP